MNRRHFLAALPTFAALTSCGGSAKAKLRLALNWKPDPQFGGFYAAPYEKQGLDIEILPGGAGTPTVQMVGAGSAEFGIVSADELVLARSKGNDVVALFAVFQNCPQGLMTHASRNLASIGDIFKEGTVALQRGLPYARLLEKKFGFDKVKIVPSPGGDISAFLRDPKFAQQCFVMSEPLQAQKAGVPVKTFPVADAGYNPYTTVLATSGQFLRANEASVKAMVIAVREGWRTYQDSPTTTNALMQKMNPSMDTAAFAEVATAQKPFIEATSLGAMTQERWQTLIDQLKDLGDIPQAMPATDCFQSV